MTHKPFVAPGRINLIVRTLAEPASIAPALKAGVEEIDGNLEVLGVRTLDDLVDGRLGQERLLARLSAGFGIVALILASIGLYGLMSYSISRRTNEIGVRMAIEARRSDVSRMVLRETLVLTALGLAVGLPTAHGASQLIKGMLYGLSGGDPWVALVAVTLLLVVATASALVPAVRAARIDPLRALRHE